MDLGGSLALKSLPKARVAGPEMSQYHWDQARRLCPDILGTICIACPDLGNRESASPRSMACPSRFKYFETILLYGLRPRYSALNRVITD